MTTTDGNYDRKTENNLSAFEVAQAEAARLGLTLSRVEKKPGGAEHWMYDRHGSRMLNYWPKTLKAHFPNAVAFIVPSDAAALQAAHTRQVPPQPTEREYLKMKSLRGQEFSYSPEQKNARRARRKSRGRWMRKGAK